MPIVVKKPIAPAPLPPNPVAIHIPEVKPNFIDTRYNPLQSLITNIEGSKWVVDFYSQVIDTSDALSGQDIGQSGVYQQYKLIKGLEVKVDSPLATSQDDVTKSMNVVGSAHIHSMIIPNKGDMFLADVGDGRTGIFQLTGSEKRSMLAQSVYLMEYVLIDYATDTNLRKMDLDKKVIVTLHYMKDFANYGQNPLVTTTEHDSFLKLHDLENDLIDAYFRWFFSVEKKALLVPGQTSYVYDHYLTKFVLNILGTNEHPRIMHTKTYNVDEDVYMSEPTIFDVILKRDPKLLSVVNNEMGFTSKNLFTNDPMQEGFRFANIPFIVYPKVSRGVFNSVTPMVAKQLSDITFQNVPTRSGDLIDIMPINVIAPDTSVIPNLPDIISVLTDKGYVFTKTFYSGEQVCSKLEWVVHKFLNEREINASEVYSVAKDFNNWGGLERFYYIPIVIAMIKYVFRSA